MIRLYQFAPALGVPNASPFCLKVETYLRLAGLDYEVETTPDPRKMPMGKVPVIEDAGQTIADSRLIVDYLERTYPPGLDARLTEPERAVAHVVGRMLEEHLYWVLLRARWSEDAGWEAIRPAFFNSLPPVIRTLVAAQVRRKMIRDLEGQGMGRLDMKQVAEFADRDLQALSTILGEQPYFFGKKPTSTDATVFGFLANLIKVPLDTPFKVAAMARQNLVDHTDRILERCFPRGG